MKKYLPFVVVSILLIVCWSNCKEPKSSKLLQPPNPPANIYIAYDDHSSVVNIAWTTVSGDVSYEVYRSVNNVDRLIYTLGSESTSCKDIQFPVGKSIVYKVRTSANNQYSDFRASGFLLVDIPDVTVRNSNASILEYNDKIRIIWDAIENPDVIPAYEVYRYLSKADSNPVKIENTITSLNNTLYLDDTAIISTTPYYYSVRWTDTTTSTNGKDSSLVFGVFVNSGDENLSEPNDNWEQLPYDITFPNMTDLFIFKNEEVRDADCFKIVEIPDNIAVINVTVVFPAEFNTKLTYEYIYNGSVKYSGSLVSNNPNYFLKNGFTNPALTEADKVYFRIIPAEAVDDFECTYDISVSTQY